MPLGIVDLSHVHTHEGIAHDIDEYQVRNAGEAEEVAAGR